METNPTQLQKINACSRLIELAASLGLDWVISFEDSDGEPHAFRLVRDGSELQEPPSVIGETEEDARDCITLAAEMKPKRRKDLITARDRRGRKASR